MSLLVDMMTNTLDESYADAARRKQGRLSELGEAADPRAASVRSRVVAALLLVSLGLVTGIAAAQVKRREASLGGVRAQLVADVLRRTTDTDALAQQTAALREQVAQLQATGLAAGSTGAQVSRDLAAVELAAGVGAVTGPGVVVRLDDAEEPQGDAAAQDPDGQPGDPGRVLDRDLQDAVNGLWAAGAEAISVNDLRLTTQTAIRSAGQAILVDFRPLSPPYVVRAIGSQRLQPEFVDGAAGRRMQSYTSLYGLRFSVTGAGSLRLPSSGSPRLLFATADRTAS